jgi:hypothetical protein
MFPTPSGALLAFSDPPAADEATHAGAWFSITAQRRPVEPGRLVRVDQAEFHGHVVWLTGEQGGRSSGPPTGEEYRATGYVPPYTVETGLASFWLRDFEPGEWRSTATAWWLAVQNEGPQAVQPGSVVVVTEGAKAVGYFHVDDVPAATA